MANSLYITAAEARSDKSAVALGIMRLVTDRVRRPALFRPIITSTDPARPDHDIDLLVKTFHLDMTYEETYACSFEEALELINHGKSDVLMDRILVAFKKLEAKYDFILCEGADPMGRDSTFEYNLNADIAANLGAPVLLVANAQNRTVNEVQNSVLSGIDLMKAKAVQTVAVIANMSTLSDAETRELIARITPSGVEEAEPPAEGFTDTRPPLFFVIPALPALDQPSMRDAADWLGAKVLYGQDHLGNLISGSLIAAMQTGSFLDCLQDGHLVVTPGDRADIVLAALTAHLSSACPDIAGILLTGGMSLTPGVERLAQTPSLPLPILSVDADTFTTALNLNRLHGRIAASDEGKIHLALDHFVRHVDTRALGKRLDETSTRMTPRMFEFQIMEQARKHRMHIVLPEGEEERILRAAEILIQRDVADLTLLGDADKIAAKTRALGLNLEKVRIIQPELAPDFEEYVKTYFELRQKKGISMDQARDRMKDATYFGTMMVYKGAADGLVSGSVNTTAHTVRPALEFIKTKPGASIVSSVFFMCLKDRILTFGDCAINPNPTPEQLADIAVTSAETSRIFGLEPRVAMLSYSTGKSGSGADVDMVAEATRIAHEKAPDLPLTGPIQYDAAIDADTARTKMPGDTVAGRATVFIFPDLNTGNNTYKAVQRAADAIAIGPVLQGMRKPVNDLSRGCLIPDIVNTVAITAVQAQAEKGLA